MARLSRGSAIAVTLLAAFAASAHAQQSLSGLPDLSTVTGASSGTATGKGGKTTATSDSDQTSTGGSTKTKTNGASSTTTDGSTTATSSASFATTGTDTVTNAPTLSTNQPFHLSSVPTIAGVGIPTIAVPYTANAPYMQKSNLPQGTVFIIIGGILAFFGLCVLLWRGLVAWSINHSVKKAALASIRGGSGMAGEKDTRYWRTPGYTAVPSSTTTGGGAGGIGKNGLYKDEYGSSSMSLEPLTSSGKPLKPHFRESVVERSSGAPPPQNLFFSPTAQAQSGGGGATRDSVAFMNAGATNRASAHMPAGYYASPSAQAAGGAASTTMGGAGAGAPAYTAGRHSTAYPGGAQSYSPPDSPDHYATQRGGTVGAPRNPSRDSRRPPTYYSTSNHNRNSYADNTSSSRPGTGDRSGNSGGRRGSTTPYTQNLPSSSSLAVGGSEVLPGGARAPSAYLDDLFDNHGSGPRERF